jgi:hypothetical protein
MNEIVTDGRWIDEGMNGWNERRLVVWGSKI